MGLVEGKAKRVLRTDMINGLNKNEIHGGFFIPLLALNLHKIVEDWV